MTPSRLIEPTASESNPSSNFLEYGVTGEHAASKEAMLNIGLIYM